MLIANHLQLGIKKNATTVAGSKRTRLFHQQHLTRAFDGAVEPALVMGWQPGVFARQDAALVGHELAEEGNVLELERIGGEINFGLGARGAPLDHRRAATRSISIWFIGTG